MKRAFIFSSLFLLCASTCYALTGAELAQMVYDREDGDDAYMKIQMTLVDKNNQARERMLESFAKDDGRLLKSYLEFSEPADIRDTRFLSWEHADQDDTQYLYLPALGRARRIVSSQKKLQFVNTDFTYEDMQRRKPDEDRHTILGYTPCYEGRVCVVMENIPYPGTSQYGKRHTLVEAESLIPVAVDYYDGKGRKIKEFRVRDLKKIDGIWTSMDIEMRDLKAGHRTGMKTLDVRYNQGLGEEIFTVRHLER